MATTSTPPPQPPSISPSHDTALCLIPPKSLWSSIDSIRSAHDRAYPRWSPHINLVYPFVQPETLPEVADYLAYHIPPENKSLPIHLDRQDVFAHPGRNVVHLRSSERVDCSQLEQLRQVVCGCLGSSFQQEDHRLHMTIGQDQEAASQHLLEQAQSLCSLSWEATHLAVLIRDSKEAPSAGVMRLWGYIDLERRTVSRADDGPQTFYSADSIKAQRQLGTPDVSQPCYIINSQNGTWEAADVPSLEVIDHIKPKRCILASHTTSANPSASEEADTIQNLVETLVAPRASADILALRGPSDILMKAVLMNDGIQDLYSYATHRPSPIPGTNFLLLSKYPFTWRHLPLSDQHEPAQGAYTSATFPTLQNDNSHPLILVLCHSAQAPDLAAVRSDLSAHQAANSVVITAAPKVDPGIIQAEAGPGTEHTHTAHNDSSIRYRNACLATRVTVGESSCLTNPWETASNDFEVPRRDYGLVSIPSLSKAESSSPACDRIHISDQSGWQPRGINTFGATSQGTCAGVRCLLVPGNDLTIPACESLGVELQPISETLGDTDSLQTRLRELSMLPTEGDRITRIRVLQWLKSILVGGKDPDNITSQPSTAALQLVLVPYGSFILGTWTSSSVLDILCLGKISSRIFFTLATQRLKKASAASNSSGIAVLGRTRNSSQTTLHLTVHGVRCSIKYAGASSLVDSWPDAIRRPSTDPIFSLPLPNLSQLKPLRDTFYLRKSIPDMRLYRTAHLAIKAWALSRGLYSAKFGLLDDMHIAALLVPVVKSLAVQHDGVPTLTASDVVAIFFAHYADFDWRARVVHDPYFHGKVTYHRAFREAVCILGWHGPSLNTAANFSESTVRLLSSEFKRGQELLLRGECVTWTDFLHDAMQSGVDPRQSACDFLNQFAYYVRVETRYWGSSSSIRDQFLAWIESGVISLVSDIDFRVAGVVTRLWPCRFVESAYEVNPAMETHVSWLVGVEGPTSPAAAKETLARLLDDFETRCRSDSRYYDGNACFLAAAVVDQTQVTGLQEDKKSHLAENVVLGMKGDDPGSDLEFEEDDVDDDDADAVRAPHQASGTVSRLSAHQETRNPSIGRFRTAADVMNRLRWDPSMDKSEWIVGYHDRFVGAMEKALGEWQTDMTNEEYIPQHRIMYFRKRGDGDGEVMWDRAKRIDKIFGSGI